MKKNENEDDVSKEPDEQPEPEPNEQPEPEPNKKFVPLPIADVPYEKKHIELHLNKKESEFLCEQFYDILSLYFSSLNVSEKLELASTAPQDYLGKILDLFEEFNVIRR